MSNSNYDILRLLSHKYPLLLVDEISQIKPLEMAVAKKCFTYNEWFFEPHFENNPIVPGSIQLEIFTQVVALPLLSSKVSTQKNSNDLILLSVDKTRYLKPIGPGDILVIQANINKISLGIASAQVKGYVNGEKVSESLIGYKINWKD